MQNKKSQRKNHKKNIDTEAEAHMFVYTGIP